jgi:hypothetical protein
MKHLGVESRDRQLAVGSQRIIQGGDQLSITQTDGLVMQFEAAFI